MRHFLLVLIGSLLLAEPTVAQTRRIALSEAYRNALKVSEAVKIQQTNVNRSSETLNQARGSILPSVSASGQLMRQDVPEELEGSVSEIQRSAKLTLNQPLFRGFSEYAAVRATKAELVSEQAFLENEKQNLFERVAKVFFDLLGHRQDLFHLTTQLKLIEKRVEELVGREKIGRSRRSEVLAAKSQAASLRAQLESTRANLAVSEAEFTLVTGMKDQILPTIAIKPLPLLKPAATYLSRVDRLYGVQALTKQMEAADERVSVARGAHLPDLDLTGNYYLKREGQLEDSKWDVILSLNMPLFAGGVTQSQVREALARKEASALSLELLKKTDTNLIQNYYAKASALYSQISYLQEAVTTADRSYEEHKKDYRVGTVTNLELLQALNATVESKRAYDRATYDYFYNYFLLRAVSGESLSEILR